MLRNIICLSEKNYNKIVKNAEKFYTNNFSQKTINKKLSNELSII